MIRCNIVELGRLLMVFVSFAVSYVESFPHDPLVYIKTALSGDNVTFPCRHSGAFSSPAVWVRPPTGLAQEKEMCLGVVCQNGYALRCSVDANNDYELTIRNVTTNDSGKYVCIAFDKIRSYRYTTELNVSDRQLGQQSPEHSLTTTSTVNDSPTAEENPSLLGVILAVIIAVTIAVLCLVIVVIIVVVTRRKVNARAESPLDVMQQLIDAKISQIPDIDYGIRPRKTDPQKVSITVEGVALISDARVLALTFLKFYRAFYDGNNMSMSAAQSFKIMASSSPIWRATLLQNNATRRRIHHLIYYECSGYCAHPTRLDSVKPASATYPVMAAVVMNGRVYTICKESDTIYVDCGPKGSIRMKDMKFPVDIVAYAAADTLYIADEECCIWRVIVGGETNKWQAFRERVPKTMSINWHGSLLVTTDSNVILKFTRSGSGGKVINLEEHTEVLHAVETRDHTAVVCYRRGTRAGFVAEFGFDGQKIREFICVPQLLRLPSYLALDRDGRLLVADPSNSRILLLDSKLKKRYTILDHQRNGIGAPQRLCLDELTGNLLVSEWPSHSIQAFNVKTPPTRSTNKLHKLFQLSV